MIRALLAAAALAASPLPAAAQEGETAALAEALVDSEVMRAQLDAMSAPAGFAGAFADMGLPAALADRASTILQEEFAETRPQLEQAMADALAESFSADDLAYLDEVYADPRLAAMSESFEAFYARLATAMQPAMAEAGDRAMRRLMPMMMQGLGGAAGE